MGGDTVMERRASINPGYPITMVESLNASPLKEKQPARFGDLPNDPCFKENHDVRVVFSNRSQITTHNLDRKTLELFIVQNYSPECKIYSAQSYNPARRSVE